MSTAKAQTRRTAFAYCRRCVEPNTRPGCIFDADGVCLPCRVSERAGEIDWSARQDELREILAWGRARKTSAYDCIIGVSGGKDSTRQSLYARDLGLKPLLVCCTYPPEQVTERGARNLSNLVRLGFDVITVSPAPQVFKKLMRQGFYKYANWCKSTELALYTSIPRIAVTHNIPLIFLGENPALAWGTDVGSFDSNANRMRVTNTLSGGDVTPLLTDDIGSNEVYWYRYPSERDIERAALRMVYLGYFIKDFNDYENSRIAIEHGLSVREGEDADPLGTGSINNFDALDDDFVHVNQFLKCLKLGFGKVSQQVSGAIRNGYMSRAEGIELVKKYDGKCGERYVREFCGFLGIRVEEFWRVAESFRNHDIWEQDERGEWRLRGLLE